MLEKIVKYIIVTLQELKKMYEESNILTSNVFNDIYYHPLFKFGDESVYNQKLKMLTIYSNAKENIIYTILDLIEDAKLNCDAYLISWKEQCHLIMHNEYMHYQQADLDMTESNELVESLLFLKQSDLWTKDNEKELKKKPNLI